MDSTNMRKLVYFLDEKNTHYFTCMKRFAKLTACIIQSNLQQPYTPKLNFYSTLIILICVNNYIN